ncbi:MAG: bifunctional 4-hydroxy-2-oxoglutarate aldolase/2-dehydro-3-deoxy-phosphogluconate aldolase [Pseudomonadota bacterium]
MPLQSPNPLMTQLDCAPVVPLIAEDDPGRAVEVALALKAGGLTVIEVVLRSEGALRCLEAICKTDDALIVGAGTVITLESLSAARAAGAQFIVSPGLLDALVEQCLADEVPVLPGVMTPGETQRAHAMGLGTVKFFPATLAGGVPMLCALAAVFRDMRFMPTGGVSDRNLAEYLALQCVAACGGSWLTPKGAEPAAIEALAREALTIASAARG